MIAASDPQEFIPGGRQQALRHPGPDDETSSSHFSDDYLLHCFEKVSLTDDESPEWWTLRKSPKSYKSDFTGKDDKWEHNVATKQSFSKSSSEMYFEDSLSYKCSEVNYSTNRTNCRLSDLISTSKQLQNKRISLDTDRGRCESKSSCYSNRSASTARNVPKNYMQNFKNEIDYMEEELYVKGNTVIWSKGTTYNLNDNVRTTVCAYTSQYPVKQAIWSTFYCERPELSNENINTDNKVDDRFGDPLPCVCVVDTQNLRVYTRDSEDFITTLPIHVGKIWNTKFGIFIERDINDKKTYIQPTVFSLTHPLDEVFPVGVSKHGAFNLIEERNMHIVFTQEDPSICMIFDSQLNQHSVYKIRRIKKDEWVDFSQKTTMGSTTSGSIFSKKFKSHPIQLENIKFGNIQQGISPFSSKAPSIASMSSQLPSRNQSPLVLLTRCNTPTISPLTRLPRLQNSVNSMNILSPLPDGSKLDVSRMYNSAEPAFCIEYLWSESINLTQDEVQNGPASKVFISEDFTNQNYLCYLVQNRYQFHIVKFNSSNANCMVFGMSTKISAKDAVPIPHLHMLAILEQSGNVLLYSGLSIVGKLHIGGVLAQHVPSPYVVRKSLKQFNSPFPRRSSLLPNCASATDPRFDEHLLSPVLPPIAVSRKGNILLLPLANSDTFTPAGDAGKTYLKGLKDAIEDRITLQYSDGSYYRVVLPPIVNSLLVENCLNALRNTMQRDAIITLLTRWYCTRNCPGTQYLTLEKEWALFTDLLLELLGYEHDQASEINSDQATMPSCSAKRQRQSCDGNDSDWNYLLSSTQHVAINHSLAKIFCFEKDLQTPYSTKINYVHVNTSSLLFPYMKIIHFTLHLLYENIKMNVLRRNELPLLASFLSQLACDLKMKYYVMHYWLDFPSICNVYERSEQLSELDMKLVTEWNAIDNRPPSILHYLHDLMRGEEIEPFPIINHVTVRTKNVVQLCGLYVRAMLRGNDVNLDELTKTVSAPCTKSKVNSTPTKIRQDFCSGTAANKVTLLMTEMNINSRELETYPMSIMFVLHEALWKCRENPPADWSSETYQLLQRPDLASQTHINEIERQNSQYSKYTYTLFNQVNQVLPVINRGTEGDQEDGMEEVDGPLLKLRFSDDLRVAEARKLLQSSKPVPIILVQRPDVSDHDFIEEQEKHLYAICTRTMALPLGRGMFTLRTTTPVITEPLPIPALCLTGKLPPRGSTVELTHIDTPPNMNLWPLFHNGVANGLRIDPEARNIDSTWIRFNKPKSNVETLMEHAGFLMALGLNGHLKHLEVNNTFDYLTKFHEMTSVGLLLGLSAAFRATSNITITKMLSVHVEALLPPTSMELDVPQNLQVAGLLGVGLIYQGTAHRHITEVLLTEIGRPPGPEMENSIDRESYSLAAGLGLGLVTLRQGGRPSGLSDLNVPDTLHYYMIGGNKRPIIGSQKDKYKVASFQIREGASVNLDITAPGATLALGLMYLATGNKAISDWMSPPETQYLLDFVRPDFLMLRTLSRALILWNEIEPEKEWVENQVPNTIRPHCMVKPRKAGVDYEAMNQAYCNIIAGACFALGLRFAGTADEVTFQTLLEYCHMFVSLTSKSIAELAGKPTIETCLNVVLLSLAMVMAGTGNLEVMRIVRFLRRRVGISSSAVVTYGSHLAIHMALGLLFLGGGRYTLSNSPASVAALICAFYPKFPTHSNDNRYHLQAFRHLYVLAVESRLVIPRNITTGKMCYATISVIKLDGTTITLRGPGLIPDLNTLYKVSIKDERYWPVVFERERNWDQLLKLLSSCCCVDVKQRAGCLSYSEDKQGFRTELARALTQSDILPWNPLPKSIVSFSSDCIVRYFTDHFLMCEEKGSNEAEARFIQNLTRATYDCVVKDKLSLLPIWIHLKKVVKDLSGTCSTIELWHFKIICAYVLKNSTSSFLANTEQIGSLHQQALMLVDNFEPQLRQALRSFILGIEVQFTTNQLQSLANFVTFHDVPYDCGAQHEDLLELMCKLNAAKCSSETVDRVLRILGYIR